MIEIVAKFKPESDFYEIWPGHTYIARDAEQDVWYVGPYYDSRDYPEDEYPEGTEVPWKTIGGPAIVFHFSRSMLDNIDMIYQGDTYIGTGVDDVDIFVNEYIFADRLHSQDDQIVRVSPKNKNYKLI